MQTLSPRQTHAENLRQIADLSGDEYYRAMSFEEADTWLNDYDYYYHEGYPREYASMYAFDHFHINRRFKRDAQRAAQRRG